MAQAITRLFDHHNEAADAVRQLERAGVPHDDISLIANNTEGRHLTGGRRDDGDDDNETAEGAGKGATTGGLIGGGAGLLAGLGMLAIPGLGPVVAAGWLASAAVGAAVGAAAGGAAGGLLGALKDAGHNDDDAQVYAEGVRRGGALVSVKAKTEADADLARSVLDGLGVEASTRGEAYRTAGWPGFDGSAQPYSSAQIDDERARYAETRTFGGEAADAIDDGIDRPRSPGDPASRPF